MKNEIFKTNKESIERIKYESEILANSHVVELHGKLIQSWEDYISKIEEFFELPTQWVNNIDSYLDWMRDLEWLGKDSYALIIYGHESFLEENLLLRDIIMEDFRDVILPWWQEEVEKCVVDGKTKPFNVYLVD